MDKTFQIIPIPSISLDSINFMSNAEIINTTIMLLELYINL